MSAATLARPELLEAVKAAALACQQEAAEALAAGPGASCCAGCGCVRVLITADGLVCALCGAQA